MDVKYNVQPGPNETLRWITVLVGCM